MTAATWLAILVPSAYLAGSIPFGLIVGLSKGIDPRKAGSGNIGATNVGRLLGGKFFAIVFVLDLLKGFVPTLVAGVLLSRQAAGPQLYGMWLCVAFAAIAGHMFSVFLSFKGGKGVATSLGVVLGVWPFYTIAGVIAGLTWAAIFWRTRIVSMASIIAAIVFPLAYAGVGAATRWPILGAQWPLLAFAVFVAVMIVWKHRGNIARLRAGTENRFARAGGSSPDSAV
jgi:glycerol-3-phosphate acyltransferase PlsY